MITASIPIIVGVTGHRQYDKSYEGNICASVKRTLTEIKRNYPDTPVRMLTSLSEGADLLCARMAVEMNIELLVVLPMEQNEYRKDFSPSAAEEFDRYCRLAASLFVAPCTEEPPQNPDRSFFYRQAGIYVACHSHILMALWDGCPAGEYNCGTASTVDFAMKGLYYPKKGIALRSGNNEAVVHIFTPRTAADAEKSGDITVLGDQSCVSDILTKTNQFNSLASALAAKQPASESEDTMEAQADYLYSLADTLSSAAAGKYKRLLGLSSVISTLFALFFLLYDEANITWMILLCGLMLITMGFCLFFAKKSDCHFQYVEYRVLAEYLRVQSYLFRAGSNIQAATLMPWAQQCENTWIMVALSAITIGNNPHKPLDISDSWVHHQQLYHGKAITSTGRKVDRNNRVISVCMIASVVLYIIALVYEALFGDLFVASIMDPNYSDFIRNSIKIFLGVSSASTMFIANYYGKIALDRRLTDHQKMEKFFKKLYEAIALHGQTEELLEYLAREELIENGNWYSYQINNKLDLSI